MNNHRNKNIVTKDTTNFYDEEGNLLFNVTANEEDLLFDEIGSVLKIKQLVYKFPSDEDISEELQNDFFGVDLVSMLNLNSILELGI